MKRKIEKFIKRFIRLNVFTLLGVSEKFFFPFEALSKS